MESSPHPKKLSYPYSHFSVLPDGQLEAAFLISMDCSSPLPGGSPIYPARTLRGLSQPQRICSPRYARLPPLNPRASFLTVPDLPSPPKYSATLGGSCHQIYRF